MKGFIVKMGGFYIKVVGGFIFKYKICGGERINKFFFL